jgi:hypothetical protein
MRLIAGFFQWEERFWPVFAGLASPCPFEPRHDGQGGGKEDGGFHQRIKAR